MAVDAEFSRFSGTYAAKNGTQAVKASPLSLARAMISVGYQDVFEAIDKVGSLRAISITAMSAGFFTGNLRTTATFDLLETTEKVGVTFLAASGLTLLAAEQHLAMRHLLHFATWKQASAVPTAGGVKSKSKLTLTDKSKSRPDFVGYDLQKGVHIFESKGRSATEASQATHADRTLQKALAQVGRVVSVQGQVPLTRVACLWSLGTDMVVGAVVDPEEEVEAVQIKFDEREAALRLYASVAGDWFEREQRALDGDFVGVQILSGVDLVVDREVFELIRILKRAGGPLGVVDQLLSVPQVRKRYGEQRASSVGANGIGLRVSKSSPYYDVLVA